MSAQPLVSVLNIRERSLAGTLEGLLGVVVFLPLLLSYLPLGFMTSAVNFTYGARGLDPGFKAGLLQRAVIILFSTYALEAGLRGKLLRAVLTRQEWKKAFWMHLGAINLFLLPWACYYGFRMEGMGFLRFFLMENLLQACWALFFLRTGSIWATAVLHAIYSFIRYHIVNDVAGPFETFYFYSAASDDFYWMMLAVTLAAVAAELAVIRVWGMREGENHA